MKPFFSVHAHAYSSYATRLTVTVTRVHRLTQCYLPPAEVTFPRVIINQQTALAAGSKMREEKKEQYTSTCWHR